MKKLLLITSAVLLLSACGTTTKISQADLDKPIAKDRARVVIERDNSFLYMGGATDVRVNGLKVASLGLGGGIVKDIPKGRNAISVSTPMGFGRYTVNFDAKPFETYNFEISPRPENIMGGFGMGMLGDAINANVSEQSGYFQIQPVSSKE